MRWLKRSRKSRERGVALAQPLQHEFAVGEREHAERARQTHEVDAHLGGRIVAALQGLDLARGKSDFGVNAEARDFIARIAEASDHLASGRHAGQQAHGLEELEAVGLAVQHVRDRPAL